MGSDGLCQALATLADSDGSWWTLLGTGYLCRTLAGFDGLWLALTGPGLHWWALAVPDGLTTSAGLRQALMNSGEYEPWRSRECGSESAPEPGRANDRIGHRRRCKDRVVDVEMYAF